MNLAVETLYVALLEGDDLKAEVIARDALRHNNLLMSIQQLFSIHQPESSIFFKRLMQLPSIREAQCAALILSRWHNFHPHQICEWLSSPQARGIHELRSSLLSSIQFHRLRADIYDLLGDNAPCVFIPAGDFIMGSPTSERGRWHDETQRHITISTPLIVSKTPLTNAQWYQLMLTKPPPDFGENDLPVTCTTWFDAVAYCNALSLMMDLPMCYNCENEQGTPGELYDPYSAHVVWQGHDGYRLPTEEEWEYFCRAGTATATYYGDFSNRPGQTWEDFEPSLDPIAWYSRNSGFQRIHPVGRKLPNPWGLWDTIGNVYEWCWNAVLAQDSLISSENADLRVARGGSGDCSALSNRAAARELRVALKRYHDGGIRFVRSVC